MLVFSDISLYKKDKGFYQNRIKKQRVKGILQMGTTETKKMRVGVVGCGAISDIYLTNMIHNFENLEVAACCAGHLEHAKKKAEQYGIKGCTYEEILADPSIEW